jgi:hypothetical protein
VKSIPGIFNHADGCRTVNSAYANGRRSMAVGVAIMVLIALVACSKQSASTRRADVAPTTASGGQALRTEALPSGYRLLVIQEGPVYSATTHRVLGLMLSYQTNIPLSDVPALRRQADGIFRYVRVDAERGGYSAMVLSATQTEGRIGPFHEGGGGLLTFPCVKRWECQSLKRRHDRSLPYVDLIVTYAAVVKIKEYLVDAFAGDRASLYL